MRNQLLKRLAVMYGAPDSDNPEAWLSEAERLLAGFTETVLEKAFDEICDTHRGKSHPPINEILKACHTVAERIERDRPRPMNQGHNWPEWSEESERFADREMDCGLGHTALREGWGHGVHEFLRKHRKWPNARETAAIKRQAREVEGFAFRTLPANASPMDVAIQDFAKSIIERREKVAARIIGEVEGTV